MTYLTVEERMANRRALIELRLAIAMAHGKDKEVLKKALKRNEKLMEGKI